MAKSVFYIPNGPKNLAQLFPTIAFSDIEEFYVQAKDGGGTIIATGNINQMQICDDDYFRIHFLNRLGAIDAVNFLITGIEQETKSDTTENPTKAPLVKSLHAVNRFNVRSNDSIAACNTDYQEDELDFIDELFASPLAWIQWKGTQGQADEYIPIVLNDQKNQKRKMEDRFTYEVTIEFKLSHEKFIIRN